MLSLIARPFVPPGNSSSWFLRASSVIAICRSPGDVQLDYQQLARPTHGLGHGVGVSAGGNDGVTGGQRGFDEIDPHATACSSNEPNPLIHGISFLFCWCSFPSIRRL